MRVAVLPSFGCLKPGQKNRGHPLSQVRDRPATRQARRDRILSPASRPAGSCRVCRCRSRQLSVGLVTAFQASISCRGRRIRSDTSPGTSLPSRNRGSGASDSTNADTAVGGAPLHGKAGKMDAYLQNHGPREFGRRSRIGRLARSRGYGQAKRSPSRMTAGLGLSPRYCRLVGVDMTHWGCAR